MNVKVLEMSNSFLEKFKNPFSLLVFIIPLVFTNPSKAFTYTLTNVPFNFTTCDTQGPNSCATSTPAQPNTATGTLNGSFTYTGNTNFDVSGITFTPTTPGLPSITFNVTGGFIFNPASATPQVFFSQNPVGGNLNSDYITFLD